MEDGPLFRDNVNLMRDELDPWRVILTSLFELDSYHIPQIIDKSGMTVDWTLTERENHSHKYRKDAFRPRINKSYDALSKDNRLRVAYIVTEELINYGLEEKLNSALAKIDWQIAEGKLFPASRSVSELFFPRGTQHDAYVELKNILLSAKRLLRVIDPYLDGTIFIILGDIQNSLNVELLTDKFPSDFELEADIFQQQHKNIEIEIRRSKDFHDRFIIIDETECWHIGGSIKDAGKKGFMLSKIEDPKNIRSLLHSLDNAWNNATAPNEP